MNKICSEQKWVLCPVCNHKTRLKLQKDTIIIHLPLFCPKCKREMLVDVKSFKTIIVS